MTYEQAQAHCKKIGARRANEDGIRAIAAEIIGARWCMYPKTIYNWAQKHDVKLRPGTFTADQLSEAVLNDAPIK